MEVMKAFIEGKTIQCKRVDCNDWYDCNPAWDWPTFEYRVKPEAPEKSSRAERHEMASAVSNAVWEELMARAKNIEGPINPSMVGFGFNDISDLVLNKILEYKPEDKPVKRLRRMTYKELEDWLIQCNGLIRIDNKTYNNIYFDCEDRNKAVKDGIEICGHKEYTWHEPMIEESLDCKTENEPLI